MQVKGSFLRPGHAYCLVGRGGAAAPDLPWIKPTNLLADDAMAVELTVPDVLSPSDLEALQAAGLSTVADIEVRPVGLMAAAWVSEGTAEWLVGEPAMIAIRAERRPDRCVLTVEGTPYVLPWPVDTSELFVGLDGLGVGSHEIAVDLLAAAGERPLAAGSLVIVVREPQLRRESAAYAEGIRLLASPARPSLTDLWDGRASIAVEGPPETPAELAVALCDAAGRELRRVRRRIELPLTSDGWSAMAGPLRREFRDCYDMSESVGISVSRAGIGFASLTADRGFQPLRWILTRRERMPTAQLIDRTDGENTRVEYLSIEYPTITHPISGPSIDLPELGGLVRAKSGESIAALILPPNRNTLLSLARVRPRVPTGPKTTDEVMRLLLTHAAWYGADLPADPFAKRQQGLVLDAITSRLVSLIAGTKWSNLEASLDHEQVIERLSEMQRLVGESYPQRALAAHIAANLWKWAESPRSLADGFTTAISDVARGAGLGNRPDAGSFLLTFAGKPGRLATWESADRARLVGHALTSPVLVRAARFAVLGTAAFHADADSRIDEGWSA